MGASGVKSNLFWLIFTAPLPVTVKGRWVEQGGDLCAGVLRFPLLSGTSVLGSTSIAQLNDRLEFSIAPKRNVSVTYWLEIPGQGCPFIELEKGRDQWIPSFDKRAFEAVRAPGLS